MKNTIIDKAIKLAKSKSSVEITHEGKHAIMLTGVNVSQDKLDKSPLIRFEFKVLEREEGARLTIGMAKIPFVCTKRSSTHPIFVILSRVHKEVPTLMNYVNSLINPSDHFQADWRTQKLGLAKCRNTCDIINGKLTSMKNALISDIDGVTIPTNLFFANLTSKVVRPSTSDSVNNKRIERELQGAMSINQACDILKKYSTSRKYMVNKETMCKMVTECKLNDKV